MARTPPANRLSTIVEKLEECARQMGSCAGFHAEFDLTEAAVGFSSPLPIGLALCASSATR
jgi:hypothetical protein